MDEFISEVKTFLEALGCSVKAEDEALLSFSAKYVSEYITNSCNLSSVPEGLNSLAVRMAAGEFLNAKKGAGQTDGLNVDLSAAAKQIKEGDVTISFGIGEGSSTPEQRLDALISMLRSPDMSQLARFRRLVW